MRIPRLPVPSTFVVTVLACLLLPLALLSNWTASTLSDTDTYVETVTPLASDPEVLDAARRELKVVATRALDKTPAAGRETSLVDEAIRQVTASPEFRDAWAEGNRQLHEQVLAIMADDDPRLSSSGGVVSIDLSSLVDALVDRLDDNGLATPTDVRNVDATIPLMKESDLAELRLGYRLVDALGFWLPVLWVGLVVLLLVTARRRLATLGHLALGSLITLSMLGIGLTVARQVVTEHSPGDQPLAEAVWDVVFDPLWTSFWTAVGVAGVALVARLVLGVVLAWRSSARAR